MISLKNMWILESFRRDSVFLILPALAAIGLSILIPESGLVFTVYAFLAMAVIDSGHVYTTAWRTWLNPPEMASSSRYRWTPLAIIVIFSAWILMRVPYLWTFVIAATLYHNFRQFYGLGKWYQRLNARYCIASDRFLLALCFIPAAAYVTRPEGSGGYYYNGDIPFIGNPGLHSFFVFCSIGALTLWLVFEARLWRKGIREPNRFLGLLIPALVYGYAFLIAKTQAQTLFPLIVAHGIAYFGIMSQSMHRANRSTYRTFGIALGIIFLTALVFGASESWLETNYLDLSDRYTLSGMSVSEALLTAVYLTPLFCHYVFDAFIWRSRHREAPQVFARPS